MVIIGDGFSGIGAAYEFHKKYGNTKNDLIIENHPMFDGEAKKSEFAVDGCTLYGPQGSNGFGPPNADDKALIAELYRATGLPLLDALKVSIISFPSDVPWRPAIGISLLS